MKKTILALTAVSLMALAAPAFADPPAANATPASTSSSAQSSMRTPTNTAASTVSTSQRPSASLYRAAQNKLKADSLYNGPINGRRTDATIQAIRAFQTQHHLTASGYLDRETRHALGV